MNPRLGYRDNFFSDDGFGKLARYAASANYHYGKVDHYTTPPTGMVHDVERDSDIWNMIKWRIEDHCPFIDGMDVKSIIINSFAPLELPYFHQDYDARITFIYYLSPWQLDEGGCTEIFIDDEIRAYPPIPNRMVWFDSMLQHRATSRRSSHRFAYAIKYM